MKKVQVCGHRGYPAKYPQNTMPSFTAAIDVGCDRVEYDVHWTKDRKLVICHDSTINSTSDGCGAIADMTYEELLKYDFGVKKGVEFTGTRIPRMEEALDMMNRKSRSLFHLVELKVADSDYAEAVLLELAKRHMQKRFSIVSFHLDMLRNLKKKHPEILIHGNPPTAKHPINFEDYRGFDFVGMYRENLSEDVVRGFHSVGVSVDAWPVDSIEELERLIPMGIDSVTSNNPELIIGHLKRTDARI